MASIGFDKCRKRWRVDFIDRDSVRRRRFFQFQANARDFWKQAEFREERVGAGLRHSEPILFADAAAEFAEQYLVSQSASYRVSERRRLRKLCTAFAGKWLHDVDVRTLDEFVARRLREGASHKTVTNDLSILSSLFRWAVPRHADENPVDTVKKPAPLPRRTRRRLSRDEVERILVSACDCCRPLLLILVNTGIRTGELEKITRDDFDFARHILSLRHTEDRPLKGKRGRVIPLNDEVERVVRALPPGPMLQHSIWTFRDHFRAACKRAGVDACPHELRHTYLSEMVSSGAVDLLTARQVSGHSQARTLEKYLHWSGEGLDRVRNAVQFSTPDTSKLTEWSVTPECRTTWSTRTKHGEIDRGGQTKNNEISNGYADGALSEASPTGFEPVLPT